VAAGLDFDGSRGHAEYQSKEFLIRLDAVGSAEYCGVIPIRLRGVLQAKLDVNGDGAPRVGFASLPSGDVWRRPPTPRKGVRMESSVAPPGQMTKA
jgi:hypothetical protein